MQNKLKVISQKNKKLLESISTHLINNPDELQTKLHQQKFLEQKFNQLYGFSRQNVQRYEKMQSLLLSKEQQIGRLNKIIAEVKQQSSIKIQMIQRQNKRKRNKEEEDIEQYKQDSKALKKQNLQNKEKWQNQKKNLQAQIESYKKMYNDRMNQLAILQQSYKNYEKLSQQKVKKLQTQSEQQNQKIKQLQQQIRQIQKINRAKANEQKRAGLDQLLKKIKKDKKQIQ